MDTPLAPEQGVDGPTNARELAIQRLKMKQDFKGVLAGGLFAVIIVVVSVVPALAHLWRTRRSAA